MSRPGCRVEWGHGNLPREAALNAATLLYTGHALNSGGVPARVNRGVQYRGPAALALPVVEALNVVGSELRPQGRFLVRALLPPEAVNGYEARVGAALAFHPDFIAFERLRGTGAYQRFERDLANAELALESGRGFRRVHNLLVRNRHFDLARVKMALARIEIENKELRGLRKPITAGLRRVCSNAAAERRAAGVPVVYSVGLVELSGHPLAWRAEFVRRKAIK